MDIDTQMEHHFGPKAVIAPDRPRVVSMWRYDDHTDRTARRAAMLADPDWPGYLEAIRGMIDVQNIRILAPTGFSALK